MFAPVRTLLTASTLACGFALLSITTTPSAHAATGQLEIRAIDKDTGEPVAVRMHLRNAKGKAVKPPKLPFWHDHFVFDGKVVLDLPVGNYEFEMERGPEYRSQTGYFTIERNATDNKEVVMDRFIDMTKHGWWSGELHVHRPLADIELLMLADDLHVAPVITWWNDRNPWSDKKPPAEPLVRFATNRYYHVLAGEDEREGGALLYFGLPEPLPLAGSSREYPSPVEFLKQAKAHEGVHVDIEKPFWWDVPIWVSTGLVDSIGLAHNHMHRGGVLPNEAWGRPRDKARYPDPQGNGRWTTDIYYHLLNCGLRIPPSAGSASGVLPNPVGYNRVYVYCGEELTYEKWFEGLRTGKVVVTNGPLIRPRVNGELPGYVFHAGKGEKVELSPALSLSTRDPIDYLEVVQDGKVVHEVRLDEYAQRKGTLPSVVFERSGWMLIRAVVTSDNTYRFASTGPYYVEIGNEPRISRASAQFFLDWVDERAQRVRLDDEDQRREVLSHHEAARKFWQDLVDGANAE